MDPTIVVAGIALVGSVISGVIAARGARAQARETAASAERIEQERIRQQQQAEIERQRRDEINQLRANLEAIITRLNAEVDTARSEMGRIREQLDREEKTSDGLRAKIWELEEKLHHANMRLLALQHELAALRPANAEASPGGPPPLFPVEQGE